MGPCAMAPMLCEGARCPVAASCPLVALGKAPEKQPCPFEVNYVVERFVAWMVEFGRTLDDLEESERAVISQLVELDLEESRIRKVLAFGPAAGLVSTVVRNVNEAGEPTCWEDVAHPLLGRLTEIAEQRRAILRDFELTREMQTRRRKLLGEQRGDDLAFRQSQMNDKIRKLIHGAKEPDTREV